MEFEKPVMATLQAFGDFFGLSHGLLDQASQTIWSEILRQRLNLRGKAKHEPRGAMGIFSKASSAS
jgi:hypothetical protein